jgi:porphobilinogen synthase
MVNRPRRLRATPALRKLVRETRVDKSSLIYPVFVREGTGIREEIPAMPGQFRYSPDTLPFRIEEAARAGVAGVMIFGIPDEKDEQGSGAWADTGIAQQAMRVVKREFPGLLCFGDVCLCEYTSHGHCGVLKGNAPDNDATLRLLAKTAVSQAAAGADVVAPSDMMDGRVAAIRAALDENGFEQTPILSYAVKYASSFYGPFREAAGSAPAFGDRKGYQMDVHNRREALKEALLDVEEGADMLMVKPAMAFGDILREVKDAVQVPVAAYSVSGEYSLIKAAAAQGWINEADMVCETAVSAFRAGADLLVTYFAPELARYMDEGRIG